MPAKAQRVIGSKSRFKVLYGGRGSAKSYSFADALLNMAARMPLRILCARETQRSIRDSVHKLLCDRIENLELQNCFTIQRDSITSFIGSEIIFKGLRHNISEVKSMEGVDICWVEEAGKVSAESWDVLIPTIRKEDSEIWISFNPEDEHSATHQRFIKNPPPFCVSEHMTYRDNKYFPDILLQEVEYDRQTDPDKYEHVWEGKIKKYHNALIFGSKIVVEEFEAPKCIQFYYGCDWGFSNDPMAISRMYILNDDLYIDYEFYATGVDYEEYEAAFNTIPGIRQGRIRADSAYPASVSYVRNKGFDIIPAKKGPGSVEDGILFLRSFRHIYIHTRCKGTIDDFKNYRYKQDPLTKEILPIIVDKSNHIPDAVRYALEPLIKSKGSWGAV